MIVNFFDRQNDSNPWNGQKIEDSETLLKALSFSQSTKPFVCELVGERGHDLLLGISSDRGFAQHGKSDGSIFFVAADETSEEEDSFVEYFINNTPTPVKTRHNLPILIIQKVAIHFLKTGERDPSVKWELI